MNGYICLKACTLYGTEYLPGDLIPVSAVLPSRERALIHQGYFSKVGEVGSGFELPEDSILIKVGNLEEEKQVAIQQGTELAASILGMNATEAVPVVKTVVQPFVLELISLCETRKTVMDAVAARRAALEDVPSTFTRDSDNTGGEGCQVLFHGHTAFVSGEIAWYPEDASLEWPAGCRVGFEILPPDDLEDTTSGTWEYDGSGGLISESTAGDTRKFCIYPLVTEGTDVVTFTVDWDGDGPRASETFTAYFSNITLQELGEAGEA